MRHNLYKDKKNRLQFSKFERKQRFLKLIKVNQFLPARYRLNCAQLLRAKGFFEVKLHNYCVHTGRSRGILRKFHVSRMVFKQLVGKGIFYGIKKASW